MNCPKCGRKAEKVDGRKIGGIIGDKYHVCIVCRWMKPVKHRRK